jgi:hypothetical protein
MTGELFPILGLNLGVMPIEIKSFPFRLASKANGENQNYFKMD